MKSNQEQERFHRVRQNDQRQIRLTAQSLNSAQKDECNDNDTTEPRTRLEHAPSNELAFDWAEPTPIDAAVVARHQNRTREDTSSWGSTAFLQRARSIERPGSSRVESFQQPMSHLDAETAARKNKRKSLGSWMDVPIEMNDDLKQHGSTELPCHVNYAPEPASLSYPLPLSPPILAGPSRSYQQAPSQYTPIVGPEEPRASHKLLFPQSSEFDYYSDVLPPTMMPPTVLASVMMGNTRNPQSGRSSKQRKLSHSEDSVVPWTQTSPQATLERFVKGKRRASDEEPKRLSCEEAGYETVPSPLQLASYGPEIFKAVHRCDVARLSQLLQTGLSRNPCSRFRDSLIDLVCKRANEPIFKCMISHGCELRTCDGFGRTPLHHCCWSSEFCEAIASTILEIDPIQLFIEDKQGRTPLEYVPGEAAENWVSFLELNLGKYLPQDGELPQLKLVAGERPENCLPDPADSIPIHLASTLTSGKMQVEELQRQRLSNHKWIPLGSDSTTQFSQTHA